MSPIREMVAKPWSFSWVAANAEMMAENDSPVRIATGTASDGERRMDGAEGGHHPEIGHRGQDQPNGDPREVAEKDVDHPQRGGQHGVVGPDPLDGRHHRVHRVARGDLHRAGGQKPGGHEAEVGHVVDRADVLVDQASRGSPPSRRGRGRGRGSWS